MKKVMCYLFGHKPIGNFKSAPNKLICVRCKAKWILHYPSLEYKRVNKFEGETRTDEELIKKWIK